MIRDRFGFIRPRRVRAEVLEWAHNGSAAKLRGKLLARKRGGAKRRDESKADAVRRERREISDRLVEAAREALAKLPRQALRDEVITWVERLGLGKR